MFRTFSTIGNESAFLEPGSDVDTFVVQMNAGDVLTINLDQRDFEFDSVLRLFDSSGAQLAISDNDAAPGETAGIDPYLRYVAPVDGFYYASVSGKGNIQFNPVSGSGTQAGRFGRVNVAVMVFTPGAEEPNDTLAQATATNLTSAAPGVFTVDRFIGDNPNAFPPKDVDVYSLQLDAGDTLQIDVTGMFMGTEFSPEVAVLDSAGQQLSTDFLGHLSFSAVQTDTYYVQVDSGGFLAIPYHLRIAYKEPNDSPAVAVSTELSSAQPGLFRSFTTIGDNPYVSPENDVDLYAVDLDQGERLRADIDVFHFTDFFGALTGLNSALRLLDTNGQEVPLRFDNGTSEWIYTINSAPAPGENDPQGDPYLDYVAEQAGRYYLEVSADFEEYAFGSFGQLTGSYELILRVGSGVSIEPNDVLGDAVDTGLGPFTPGTFIGSGNNYDNPLVFINDVEMLSFQLDAGSVVTIDVDARTSSGSPADSVLRLFDVDGSELQSSEDAHLSFTASSFGTYYVGLSTSNNEDYDPNVMGSGPNTFHISTDYDIVITVSNSALRSAVPAARAEMVVGASPASVDMIRLTLAEANDRWFSVFGFRQSDAVTSVEVRIADLADGYLGVMSDNVLWLDHNADGYGWFVDPTPEDDLEFVALPDSSRLVALSGDAADRIDLLTVVMHEMGHALGLEHSHTEDDDAGLMSEFLEPGVRRLPQADDLDGVFAKWTAITHGVTESIARGA